MSQHHIRILTLGYQGINIEEYVDVLISAGVNIVLDVRENAWSYKRGFSKSPLREALQTAGIEYCHVRSAGNPATNRKSASTTEECLQNYKGLIEQNPEQLSELVELILTYDGEGKSVCLTCYERHPSECHRSVILDVLHSQHPEFDAVHLNDEPSEQLPLRL